MMANSSKHDIYEFDEFRIDAAKLMLYRAGREVALPPKVVQTLLVLVENRGEIIGKDELMNRVWADSVVEESNLSQSLYRLRKTLGNQPGGAPYIETFRRRGYRFNGDVRVSGNLNGFSLQRQRDTEQRQRDTEAIENLASKGESQMKTASPRQLRVERRGNVLALADWTENERDSSESESAAEPDRGRAASISNLKTSNPKISNSKSRFPLIAAAALVIALLLAAVSFVRYKSAANIAAASPPDEKKELTFLRLTNGNAPIDATISPDGKHFVYHEQDGETAHLWLQQTGESNRLEIISPSERTIYGKTFSPDGAFVYFIAQDKDDRQKSLYRVPTLGGAQMKILTDINSPVSFSPDGREMVFGRWNEKTGDSALVIAASDGSAERILLARTGEQENLVYPAWSPDGGLIAFCAVQPQSIGVLTAVNLQTGASGALSPEKWDTCYRMIWTKDGQGLIFVGTKYAEGSSTRRDQIYYLSPATGEARRLTFDGSRHGVSSLGVTDDDSIIAVPFNRSSQIWQMSPDGDARSAIQITNGQADGRAGLAPLPDRRVGYITRTGENLSIWLMNRDGTDQKQLITDFPFVEELRAAPDASFFVFSAERDRRSHLFRIDTNGANLFQLTFGDSRAIDSTVSPDGNWIVYSAAVFSDKRWKHSLWKIPASGGAAVLLNDINCYAPHFSPDGKSLSCIRDEKEIVVVSAADGAILKTFETIKHPTLNTGARWTPDGHNLVYMVHRKNVSNLWLQPTGGAAARPLTDFTSGSIYNFAFSPDGARLYVARGNQINDAVLIKNFK